MKGLFYRNYRARSIAIRCMKLFIITFVCVFLVVWIAGMRDIIDKYALNRLEYLVTSIIDRTVYDCFAAHRYDYESLIVVTKDNNGRINSISIEPYAANMLKSEISRTIVDRVNERTHDDLEITLGMLVGHFGLGSWGPVLPLTVTPNGNVNIDFTNTFESCGINQVQDNVFIDVNVDVSAMMPFYQFNSRIHSSVLISQTVIIGDVPGTYLNIGEYKR